MRKFLLSCVAVAGLSLIPTAALAVPRPPVLAPVGGSSSNVVVPWVFIGCAGGIILAAFHANYRDDRELTQPEAWSCGLLHWFSHPTPKKRIRVRGG
ncbi:MAG: hypothetical protein M3R18_05000 [Pseudomonadota bacterium]|nr:hypothetical protein [Pseudomonadota bacterium]